MPVSNILRTLRTALGHGNSDAINLVIGIVMRTKVSELTELEVAMLCDIRDKFTHETNDKKKED